MWGDDFLKLINKCILWDKLGEPQNPDRNPSAKVSSYFHLGIGKSLSFSLSLSLSHTHSLSLSSCLYLSLSGSLYLSLSISLSPSLSPSRNVIVNPWEKVSLAHCRHTHPLSLRPACLGTPQILDRCSAVSSPAHPARFKVLLSWWEMVNNKLTTFWGDWVSETIQSIHQGEKSDGHCFPGSVF